MLKDNPQFTEAFCYDKYRFYIPTNIADYHMIRHVEASKQSIYASAGATPEVIKAHAKAIVERCNKQLNQETLRTDIAAIANALLYRTEYPVDHQAAIRMGAVLTFMEYEDEAGKTVSEDPNKCEIFWLQKKENMAFEHPDLYTFFLTLGLSSVKEWSPHLDTLKDAEYFLMRAESLRTMLPKDLLSLSK